ncbi:hypothetical protein GGQ61_002885 [Phenylobacterium haematophilum]|uniref:DUF3313 domain-containing protein n=1 Tax=Phenylobacterium haematophilum TaxID=98513 RepID=A0A840A430_9CAUL|nr:DUF3313 family protein [Phenylobacterium haematophilum]MBB3892152.1 hypothetical protein [Phenylobacterium haematophilum]
MTRRAVVTALAALCLLGSAAPQAFAAEPPASWDGLTNVKSKRFDAAYVLPGADFRGYTKVMLDPTDVAFRKNWLRDYNNEAMDLSQRISKEDAQKMLNAVSTGFEEVFTKAYNDAGYQVVTTPGPDVLRLRTGVANLYVTAPDRPTAGRSRTFSEDAGSATVVIEARDSETGALLGRAIDTREAGDTGPYMRNSVTNRSDFTMLFKRWAKISLDAMAELKAMSPIPENPVAQRR